MTLLFFFVETSLAVETTFELQKKIKSDFSQMERVNREQESKTKSLNDEIKEVVTRLTNSSDETEKEELQKTYFKKRAEYLHAEATRVVEIESALGRIAENMSLLDEEMRRSLPGDYVKGLTQADTGYIKDTLKGMANILSPLEKLKINDPRISNMALTLNNLDMGYKTFFRPGGDVSLTKQIQYIEDLHAYVYSVKLLLREETNYLKTNVYYMMQDGIVRVINDFKKGFYPTIFKGFETQHALDEKVLGDRTRADNNKGYPAPDLNNIGKW
jgi:hypothetical protein